MIDIKKDGLNVVEMGIGTWAWGDRIFWNYGNGYSESDLRAAFDYCISSGLNVFDTAEVYGQGKSEEYLGKFLKTASSKVIIATKFMPYPWRLNHRSLLKALRGSLKRLGLSQIDLYQIHQPLPPVMPETWMEEMIEARRLGLISAIGVSNYDRGYTQRAHDTLNREGILLASNQVEYHLLDREIEKNGLSALCTSLGIRIIAYSPLAMGILTGKYDETHPPKGLRGRKYNRKFLSEIRPLMDLIKRIGANRGGKTPAQISLNWVMCKGAIPIPGVKSLEQAEQNAGAIGWRLSEDEVRLLDEMSDQVLLLQGKK